MAGENSVRINYLLSMQVQVIPFHLTHRVMVMHATDYLSLLALSFVKMRMKREEYETQKMSSLFAMLHTILVTVVTMNLLKSR